jgi:4-hydroxyphenylacetate 3-monooxygenase
MDTDTTRQRHSHRFALLDEGSTLEITFERLIIAGYTGRDADSVAAHIRELETIGVAPPETVPMFYELSCELITSDDSISVSGVNTSGEVEPVIIKHDGSFYLGVGSDHTDRDLETKDVGLSKAACAKPIGKNLIRLSPRIDEWPWDDIAITASVDGILYQAGSLSSIRPPSDILTRLTAALGELADGTAVYAGTVTLQGNEFVPGRHWQLSLSAGRGQTITHTYAVEKE